MLRLGCAIAAWLVCAAAGGAAEPDRACLGPDTSASADAARGSLSARADAIRLEIEAGRHESAAAALDELLEEVASVPDPAERARLHIHLGRSLVALDRPRRAVQLLREAADEARGHDSRLESYALGYLAERYEAADRPDDALALARRALFAAQRAEAPDSEYRWQWQLGRLHRVRGDEVGALAAYRSAVVTLRGVPELGGPGTQDLYLELADLLLRRAASEEDPQALLVETRSALEDLKAGELRDYFRDPCLDAQRKAIPDSVPGALVVYPVPLEDRLALIVGRAGGLSLREVGIGRAQVMETAHDFRRKVEKRTTREYLRPAAQLYEWLIRPLDLAGVEALVFVPDAVTRGLPLAALYDDRSREFLIEKVPVAITPGLTLTEPRPIDADEARVLAAGVSEGVQGYPPLAGVQREIDALHELFGGKTLLDEQFEADRFEAEVREQILDVVHVASHGEFLADESESYLLTHDGKIPMEELAALVGATRFRERGLELLTLSACHTAAGDDRAALGLAGVALQAGARSAIATLWAVNDAVSSDLMVAFYTELREEGVSRATALQHAQLEILGRRAYRHPGYWAAFLLINSWL